MTATELANGFANRFLWTCVRRSTKLPHGGKLHTVDFTALVDRLRDAAEFARKCGEMTRDDGANALWEEAYDHLSAGRPGLLGAILARAEAQVMRLACLYALLDRSSKVRADHLLAALALWSHCERSARYIFGDSLGDSDLDTLLAALRNSPNGLTRTEISRDIFQGNKPAHRIRALLATLLEHGLAHPVKTETEGVGRPPERWYAADAPTKETNELAP